MRGRTKHTDVPHLVYRCFDEKGVLLYIGMTGDLAARIKSHRSHTPWFAEVASITQVTYPNRSRAACKEYDAIVAERPRYNRYPLLPRRDKGTTRKQAS